MSTETQDEICRRLMEGESLRSICAADGMPNKSTVCRWLADDEVFRGQYAAARLVQADMLADEILDISDDASNDWMERRREDGSADTVVNSENINRSRLRVDARKWMAGKLAPKKYGDATLLKHGDAEGNAVRSMSHAEMAVRLASIVQSTMARTEKADD